MKKVLMLIMVVGLTTVHDSMGKVTTSHAKQLCMHPRTNKDCNWCRRGVYVGSTIIDKSYCLKQVLYNHCTNHCKITKDAKKITSNPGRIHG